MASAKRSARLNPRDTWLDEGQPMTALGMANRRKVMGPDHVERSLAAADADPRKQKLQQCVTELAWGGVWGRPGLDMKSRSLATLSVLLALGHHEELKLHLAGALRNGWTEDELTEAMIHIACYAGWPTAVQGFRAASEVFGHAADPASSGTSRQRVAKASAREGRTTKGRK